MTKISVTGGHLASNLGVVELTMAMHLAFDFPQDKVIWDVGHQSYTHKLLTGGRGGFDGLRKYGGMSGFPEAQGERLRLLGHRDTAPPLSLQASGLWKPGISLGGSYSVLSVIRERSPDRRHGL